jgi:hypothetical protein
MPATSRRPLGPRRPGRDRRDPAANREAQRRHRERTKKCQASYRCAADGAVLNMLKRRLYIGEDELGDPHAVGEAITVFLADHAALDEA